MKRWVVRASDGMFLRDRGGEALALGEIEVVLRHPPDAKRERWDLVTQRVRPATVVEIALAQDAAEDAAALDGPHGRIGRAWAYAVVEHLTGQRPTAQEQHELQQAFIRYRRGA